MRMFTEVGRRTWPHATAVGKAILAGFPDDEVVALLERTGMPRYTSTTLGTPEEFLAAMEQVRDLGYALDEGEQEVGVRCVAVAVPDAPQPMAISMSGPTSRMTDDVVEEGAEVLTATAAEIGSVLTRTSAS
jgi:IclR family acetate operon transcriptional repressor